MIAAQLFNQREQSPLPCIYGAVTYGTDWKFLKLVDQTVYIDKEEYHISNINKIMGILVYMVEK